ncbi:sigma-70 family RNA polymerase sigma factor [Patescibacteria group bacterium]|nr:sigma-70 family RNA polymerase sigma factor [Patescibacteria group bacterium]
MQLFGNPENMSELADEDILLRSGAQPWLFSLLLDRYQDAFMRKAMSIIHNPQDAEEIVQDTFTKIYLHAASFTPVDGAKFSSWAYRILMNTAFTAYQKRIKQGARFQNIDPEFEQFVADKSTSTLQHEVHDGVERILARLPGHFASVLRLHYIERWSHQDIANETGEAVGTVKARIHRAKAAFRKESTELERQQLL